MSENGEPEQPMGAAGETVPFGTQVTNLGLKAALFSLCEKGPNCAKRK